MIRSRPVQPAGLGEGGAEGHLVACVGLWGSDSCSDCPVQPWIPQERGGHSQGKGLAGTVAW